jgi:hypothetical protein
MKTCMEHMYVIAKDIARGSTAQSAQNDKSPAGNSEAYKTLSYRKKLVAGVGFEPTTFRL